MKPVRIILFDLDDTLLHFDDYWTVSMREALRTFPLTADIDLEVLFPVFLEKDELFHIEWLEGRLDGSEFRRLRFIDTLAAVGVATGREEADAFERWYWSARAPHIPYDTSLIARLQRLAAAYPLGIVTNGTTEDQFNKLNRMGLDMLFTQENVFISDAMGAAKPTPDSYLIPARAFGVRPEEVLFVGDSWQNDVEGPIRQGMQAVWMNRKGLPQPAEPKPAAVITDLAELEELLADR
ncbi:HAD family hydrolase [Paenibacillus tarimensis]|uniref:HAD family hydrolase n=1 Tax=Paenibacillus tarimensis TaxID=416012 RepID=UPI001F206197|nr:HAD family hydrolase [Paenibacillus tarimensis]MCF2945954.1 HAD family hydrolase [Paenibacillus tarimensis]